MTPDSEQTRHKRDSKQALVVTIAPSVSSIRSKPKARPYASRVTAAASSALRTGVRTPRPSHAAECASKTCHAVVASPIAAVPNAVRT